MQMSLIWQIPIATITGVGAFYFGSALSERKNKYNLCCFTAAVLLFQSIFIFLPQVHLRFVQLFKHGNQRQFVEQQDDIFPIAFFSTALVFSMCLLLDKIILRMYITKGNLQKNQQRTFDNLRYLIPIGSSFLLFNNYFYSIKDTNVFPQFIISMLNSILINICQGYIHNWTGPKSAVRRHTGFLSNILPIAVGLTLGVVQHKLLLLSFIGILGCGLLIYSVTMLLFPILFECDHDMNSKFLCIVGGFCMTLLYYPLTHLMKV